MRLAIILAAVYATTSRPTTPKSSEDAISSEYEEEEEWVCGTDPISKYIAESQIDLDCPHLKKDVNQCCQKHDKCYDDQEGQKFCDDTFCHCLDVVTKGSDICHTEDSPLFCGMVRHFGRTAYRRAGNHTGLNATIDESQESSNVTTTVLCAGKEHEIEARNETALEDSIKDLEKVLKLYF